MNESIGQPGLASYPHSKDLIDRPKKSELFPIVGIGASAGGLQAFTELVRALPANTGMGFILIQHLDPTRKSFLTELINKNTSMVVKEVETEMVVEPNEIYIIPPNKDMEIIGGVLKLTPRTKTLGKQMQVDTFLESLAIDRGNKAIGIVLSGMDGDGALGLQAIKNAGGITFAQCLESAQFDSMPQSAIAGGFVDLILSPGEIANCLAKINEHQFNPQLADSQTDDLFPDSDNEFIEIFRLLSVATGVDFNNYKQATLKRRIRRRMLLQKISLLGNYVTYIRENNEELIALYNDLLINVTSFFREPESFALLTSRVFPALLKDRELDDTIRIWIPGCSTGEEAYSIAICLYEFLENQSIQLPIKIIATDISDIAIAKARNGIYTDKDIGNISAARLSRFFTKIEGGYQINKLIRNLCVFAKQNVSQDAPFSKLDLISCRNMLIYLGTALQKRVISMFHYALKPTGLLMLGAAETITELPNLFAPLDKKHKIYTRKLGTYNLKFDFAARIPAEKGQPTSSSQSTNSPNNLDFEQKADTIVLDKNTPAGVVVNQDLEILEFRGQTSPYLDRTPGQASLNLLKIVREDFLADLRIGLEQAKSQNIPVRKEGIQVKDREQIREVNIDISPFQAPTGESYLLILFEDVISPSAKTKNPRKNSDTSIKVKHQQEQSSLESENDRLNQQLTATQDHLQSTLAQQEITNEKFLSSNQMFQRANEELDTAKEEVQATNEELRLINKELQSRNLEITQINNDISNLLSSVNIPIVIFSPTLEVRLATLKAKEVINIGVTDIGRSLADIDININIDNLAASIAETINTDTVLEVEVQNFSGHWYNLRLLPYKTVDNQIEGAIMVLIDINALKINSFELEAARNHAEAIVETVNAPLLLLDWQWRIKKANTAFYKTFEVTPEETLEELIFDLGNQHWNIPALRLLMLEIISKDNPTSGFEVAQEFTNIGYKTMEINACKLPYAGGPMPLILLAIEDISIRKQLLASEQEARATAEAIQECLEK